MHHADHYWSTGSSSQVVVNPNVIKYYHWLRKELESNLDPRQQTLSDRYVSNASNASTASTASNASTGTLTVEHVSTSAIHITRGASQDLNKEVHNSSTPCEGLWFRIPSLLLSYASKISTNLWSGSSGHLYLKNSHYPRWWWWWWWL